VGVTVFPNPFNPEVTVSFQLEQSSSVLISVYDLLGRRVRSLVDEPVQSAGHFQQTWDGRDDDGRQMASGKYFLTMDINGVKDSRKLTLIR
jgi:flagellar hook assembly protein FlgD